MTNIGDDALIDAIRRFVANACEPGPRITHVTWSADAHTAFLSSTPGRDHTDTSLSDFGRALPFACPSVVYGRSGRPGRGQLIQGIRLRPAE